MTLVSRIKEIAKEQNLSLIDVALKAGIAENSIYGWTKKTPKVDTLAKVANILHVSTDYLLGRTDEPNHYMTETEKMLSGVDLSEAIDRSVPLTFGGHELDDHDKEILRRLFEEK
ncbi:helix-turn-helix domain-containing protein [Leuconostoc gasicomitatum]|uniref:helix-turn-helix domain-containing protein n=1 Tax=Leuconostoc gasicomitatum TaxID=115778 RepID=UPI0007DF9932|nr:helix-turn-helix transcriptional regulator [Leuconostoc gasicomitatum]CUW06866.1 putative repressor protein [Leuconostoc gasicomitatum]